MEGDGEINNRGNRSGGWRPAPRGLRPARPGSRTHRGMREPQPPPWAQGTPGGSPEPPVREPPESGLCQWHSVGVWGGGGQGRERPGWGWGWGFAGRGRGWHPAGSAESETNPRRVEEPWGEQAQRSPRSRRRGPERRPDRGRRHTAARPGVRGPQVALLLPRHASLPRKPRYSLPASEGSGLVWTLPSWVFRAAPAPGRPRLPHAGPAGAAGVCPRQPCGS